MRFFSLARSASSSAFFAGDDEPVRVRYACEGISSSELSPCCTAARFCSVRVLQPALLDGDPLGESISEPREPPTWKSAARLLRTPRRFVGDSLRMDCEPLAFVSLVFGWRRENEWWRDGGVDFALPVLKRGFSRTSN